MSFRIGIHLHDEPLGWTSGWIQYCAAKGIDYEIVDGYRNDIIERVRGMRAFMWHVVHTLGIDALMANHVLTAVEHMGLPVFPNRATRWHFDDKIAQKYLLEAAGLPLIPTYVFYEMDAAASWLRQAEYPLVAKIRRGAGSLNVRLIRDYSQAIRYCRRLFGRGVSPMPSYLADLRTKTRKAIALGDWRAVAGRVRRFWSRIHAGRRQFPRERSYVLFQKFIPNNMYDIRIAVIGDRAWGFTRDVRPDDFRASGSGVIVHDPSRIEPAFVECGFAVARALGTQSVGIDLLRDEQNHPVIGEISFGYQSEPIHACEGHWGPDLSWHPGHVWPEHAIIDDLCETIRGRNGGVS